MTDAEYKKALDYLDTVDLTDGKYEIDDYVNAVAEAMEDVVLDGYLRNNKAENVDYRDTMADYLDDFFDRLDPAKTGDPRHADATRVINGKRVNKRFDDVSFDTRFDAVKELTEPKTLKTKAQAYFNDKLTKGEPISDQMMARFYEMPLETTAPQTDKITSSIFGAQNAPADKQNVAATLFSYKAVKDKLDNTGFFKMLFHLPSYLKMRRDVKEMRQALLDKGVDERALKDFEEGKVTARATFDRSRLYKNEITEAEYREAIKSKAPERQTQNRFEKGLEKNKNLSQAERIDNTIKKMQKDAKVAASKHGGEVKRQNAIKRWKENYNQAVENMNTYYSQRSLGDENYRNHITEPKERLNAEMTQLEKNINEEAKFLREKDVSADEVKTLSGLDPDGTNRNGKPYTEAQKELIRKSTDYIANRQRYNEVTNDLKKVEALKAMADKQRADKLVKLQADEANFRKYEGRLVKEGVITATKELNAESVNRLYQMTSGTKNIFAEEEEYEEEEEELENENAPEAEEEAPEEEENLDLDQLDADCSLENPATEVSAPAQQITAKTRTAEK